MNNIVECPHCNHLVQIEQVNCGIFRHAVFKHNDEPIQPHSSKEECEKLLKDGIINGCAKPFRIIFENSEMKAIICDYI
jgi:hypothetical protein